MGFETNSPVFYHNYLAGNPAIMVCPDVVEEISKIRHDETIEILASNPAIRVSQKAMDNVACYSNGKFLDIIRKNKAYKDLLATRNGAMSLFFGTQP